MMKYRLFIFLLLFIAGIIIVNADKQKVVTEYKDITLSSDMTFFCQPIFNDMGDCLIKAFIDIDSKKDFNNDIIITFKDSGTNDITNKPTKFKGLTNKDRSKTNVNFIKGKIQRIEFEFFTSNSGKFDVNIGSYVLDPYYNVTINASSPSYHLINGTSLNISDNEFQLKTDITNGLKDNNDATKYELRNTNYGTTFIPNTNGMYNFEEGSGTTIIDIVNGNNGQNYGALYYSSKGNNNTGTYSLLFNSSARANISSNALNGFDYPESFTVGCWINASKSSATTRGIISKGYVTASNSNWHIQINGATNSTGFGVGNGTTNLLISTSSKTITQGFWNHVVVTANSTRMCIYINGVMKTCSNSVVHWKDNGKSLYIGGQTRTTNPFLGKIDECSIYNTTLSRTQIASWYNGGTAIINSLKGYSIKPKFNFTMNYSQKHFLEIKKANAGLQSVIVYPYINETHINATQYLITTLHQGWDSIEITNIIKPSIPITYRLTTSNSYANISEIRLIEQREDNILPSINDCSVNSSAATCSDTLYYLCNVTDNIELFSVHFGIYGTALDYSMVDRESPYSNYFYKTITLPNIHATYNYTFTISNATDFVGNNYQINPNIITEYSCCIPEWQYIFINLSNCSSGAEGFLRQKIYNDTHQCNKPDNLPFDNGTTLNIPCGSPSKLIINRCPDTIQLSMILIALIFIALGMIAFSIVHQIGIIGLFGSILLMITSWYLVGCSAIIGYVIGLFAILMLIITAVVIPWLKYNSNL